MIIGSIALTFAVATMARAGSVGSIAPVEPASISAPGASFGASPDRIAVISRFLLSPLANVVKDRIPVLKDPAFGAGSDAPALEALADLLPQEFFQRLGSNNTMPVDHSGRTSVSLADQFQAAYRQIDWPAVTAAKRRMAAIMDEARGAAAPGGEAFAPVVPADREPLFHLEHPDLGHVYVDVPKDGRLPKKFFPKDMNLYVGDPGRMKKLTIALEASTRNTLQTDTDEIFYLPAAPGADGSVRGIPAKPLPADERTISRLGVYKVPPPSK